jgi:hypothetical protein
MKKMPVKKAAPAAKGTKKPPKQSIAMAVKMAGKPEKKRGKKGC